MKIANQFDLTYCSNIFAGDTWAKVFQNLKINIPLLKSKLSINMPFGIGLRLSNKAAEELLQDDNLDNFKLWLDQADCYVTTINGFVYGDFYDTRVKEKVYEPDWSTKERESFNVNLIDILLRLPSMEIGFSTSPLAYKFCLDRKYDHKFSDKVCYHLLLLVKKMMLIFQETNKIIHIDFEPEADCLLETIEDVVDFFNKIIFDQVAHKLSFDLQISLSDAIKHIKQHIRICYDICHQSVQFEDHIKNFSLLEKAGIKIGKIQISSALRFKDSNSIKQFKDNVYLHQTVVKNPEGILRKYRDLDQSIGEPGDEFRVHFHLPIFVEKYGDFLSTNNDILNVLSFLKNHPITSCLEIETYTWQVLPQELQLDLISSIQKEYEWVIEKLVCKKPLS